MTVAEWYEAVAQGLAELETTGYVDGWQAAEVRGGDGFLVDTWSGRLELSPAQACDLIEAAGRERPVIHA